MTGWRGRRGHRDRHPHRPTTLRKILSRSYPLIRVPIGHVKLRSVGRRLSHSHPHSPSNFRVHSNSPSHWQGYCPLLQTNHRSPSCHFCPDGYDSHSARGLFSLFFLVVRFAVVG